MVVVVVGTVKVVVGTVELVVVVVVRGTVVVVGTVEVVVDTVVVVVVVAADTVELVVVVVDELLPASPGNPPAAGAANHFTGVFCHQHTPVRGHRNTPESLSAHARISLVEVG